MGYTSPTPVASPASMRTEMSDIRKSHKSPAREKGQHTRLNMCRKEGEVEGVEVGVWAVVVKVAAVAVTLAGLW